MTKSENIPADLGRALYSGWKLLDTSLQQGYVSAKLNSFRQPIKQVPNVGCRANQFYVELHNPKSTRYLIRQYIRPPISTDIHGVFHYD